MPEPGQHRSGRGLERVRIEVAGVVQGVGFRPYVHALATELGLSGRVGNDPQGVFIEVEGPAAAVSAFRSRLVDGVPPLAVVEEVRTSSIPPVGGRGFDIEPSRPHGARSTLVSPDVATCDDCLQELVDPLDRRFAYPFINCTNCGPRYTIVRDVPYDRSATTMVRFTMCGRCAAEYHDPTDRRFHAQPVCCPDCGPQLRLVRPDRRPVPGDPIAATSQLLHDGEVVAVKGLGGYHLAVDAGHPTAAADLRSRKHREDKPFAVMVADLEAARRLARVDPAEAGLLTSPGRPIVLLHRRTDAPRSDGIADAVAPGNRSIGVMLPYTPLHHLLLSAHHGPIVLTSGNVSDEPIAFRDEDAFSRLGGLADAFLTHDRAIHVRVDDSVTRVVAGRAAPVRRSRGYAPRPVTQPWAFPRHVLAVGAELKNTVCLARDRHAFVSHHIGDLENLETFQAFTQAIEHLGRLFDVRPVVVAHDLHPEYLSTKHARELELDGLELVGVQHHHAHIAACLADNGRDERVIGVAFDGTGYGSDGTVWGGEFLVADLREARRVAHLETVPLPGGAAAIREPWRMAAAYLRAAYGTAVPEVEVRARNAARWDQVLSLIDADLNTPLTSSAGRLFDAVSAILGIRDEVTYEGQAAIELEQRADPAARGSHSATIIQGTPMVVRGTDLVRGVLDDLRADLAISAVAGRFHHAVADAIVAVCERVRSVHGPSTVALSGGVFQNALLLERTVPALRRAGFEVLTHDRVPCNDGGISLGQVAVVGARDRQRLS